MSSTDTFRSNLTDRRANALIDAIEPRLDDDRAESALRRAIGEALVLMQPTLDPHAFRLAGSLLAYSPDMRVRLLLRALRDEPLAATEHRIAVLAATYALATTDR